LQPVPVFTSTKHFGHAPSVEVIGGAVVPSIDSVERIEVIERALERERGYRFEPPQAHGDGHILAVHSPELLDFLAHAWERHSAGRPDGTDLLIADTFLHERLRAGLEPPVGRPRSAGAMGTFTFDTIAAIGPRTYSAARASVDIALSAVDALGDGAPVVLGLTRPGGHHATADLFGGGTFLNNCAIAAQRLLDRGLDRVAVLDLDYHHGNGTQSIFYDRPEVLTASVHASPAEAYPFHVGWEDERGAGAGAGTTINVLLPADTAGPAYLDLLAPVLEEIDAFGADALVVGLGLDTHADDPFAGALQTADYGRLGAAVGELGIPTVALLEGGYNLEGLGAGVAAWMEGLRATLAPGTRTEAAG
jgi:acetoin utilization deacetylase AcuC-like enzyme